MQTHTRLPGDHELARWSDTQIDSASADLVRRANEIFGSAGSSLERATPSEVEEVRSLNADLARLRDAKNSRPVYSVPLPGGRVSRAVPAGPFLTAREQAAPYFGTEGPAGNIKIGKLIAAIAGGQKVASQLNQVEMMALSGMGTLSGPGGEYFVPGSVVGPFIDSVRPLTRVIEAGALTLPMTAQTVSLPGWDTPLTASWRGEGGAFSSVTPPVRQVNLTAKSVGCKVTLSNELLQDAAQNLGAVESIVENEVARAVAQAIDLAALAGTGVDGQPLGVQNTAGVTTDSTLGANGSTPSDYDFLLEAIGLVGAQNFEPNAVLYSARTAKTLSKLKTGLASDKTQLIVPEPLRSMRRLVTNQIGDAQTKGSSTNCSAAFTGDWSQLVIGVRDELSVLVDPYSNSGTGETSLIVSSRVDVALLNVKAFIVSDGIRP